MMRVFIGIPVPQEIKNKIDESKSKLDQVIIKGKWSTIDNLHLTLVFIGDINEDRIGLLSDILDKSLTDLPAFELSFGELGSFAKGNQFIVWLGIHHDHHALFHISRILKTEFKKTHFPYDNKPLKPHVTLVRQASIDTLQTLPRLNINLTWKVDQIHLYQSHQVEGRLTYTSLHHVKLK